MARGRMISKSLSTSQKFAALYDEAHDLAEFCQSLYPLFVSHADDFGRLQGDAFTVKHQCHPASPRPLEDFTRALKYLHNVELIVWFVVDGRWYIQILNFDPHQAGLHKRTASGLPVAPGNSRKFPEIPGNSGSRARAELNLTEGKGTEGKRREDPQLKNKLISNVLASSNGNGHAKMTEEAHLKKIAAKYTKEGRRNARLR